MQIQLSYGKESLALDLPDSNLADVLTMKQVDVIDQPGRAVSESLDNPIGSSPLIEIARNRKNACIVISDLTRATPNKVILPPILECLERSGMSKEDITILIATGIHRPNLGDELISLVGESIARSYRVVNHRSGNAEGLKDCGEIAPGVPLCLNRIYCEADLKILTGLIEPHLMAGFSGGRKSILPGIVGLETMKYMHGYEILADQYSHAGFIDRNPFHRAALSVAKEVGVDFIVNVTLDEQYLLTGVFSGDLELAHCRGIEFNRSYVEVEIAQPADIVITTGGGAPLDKTFYQAIKGLATAMSIVKPNGTIIGVGDCCEGIGSDPFKELLFETKSVKDFVATATTPGFFRKDQWMVQHLCDVLAKSRVLFYTRSIPANDLENCLVTPVSSVDQALRIALDTHGADSTIAVIPKGPYVLAKVRSA